LPLTFVTGMTPVQDAYLLLTFLDGRCELRDTYTLNLNAAYSNSSPLANVIGEKEIDSPAAIVMEREKERERERCEKETI